MTRLKVLGFASLFFALSSVAFVSVDETDGHSSKEKYVHVDTNRDGTLKIRRSE